MKNFVKAVGIIAVVVIIGFSMVGCVTPEEDDPFKLDSVRIYGQTGLDEIPSGNKPDRLIAAFEYSGSGKVGGSQTLGGSFDTYYLTFEWKKD